MKRIYTGWYTDSLRRDWMEDCRKRLQQGSRNFLFLLPTRHLIQEVRHYLTSDGVGVSHQIGTFDDLVDIGLSPEQRLIRIDEQGKLTVLERAVELAGDSVMAPFARIQDKPGFLQSLLDAIEEMKSSGIPPEDMAGWEADAAGYLPTFTAVYRNYQMLLAEHSAGRLLDRQEGYRVAAANLRQNGAGLLGRIDTVYIDFLTVTPLQFPIVEAVCRHVPHVEIFMPYPAGSEGIKSLLDSGSQLIESLKQLGMQHTNLDQGSIERELADGHHAKRELADEGHGEESWSGSHPRFLPLAKALFTEDAAPVVADGIELVPAASSLQEVRAVAKEIKRLVRDGVKPADIALVVADDAAYRPLIRQVFAENQIAVCLGDIQNQIEIPLIRQVIAAMEHLAAEARTQYRQRRESSANSGDRGLRSRGSMELHADWLPAFGKMVEPLVGEHLLPDAAARELSDWQANFSIQGSYAQHAAAVRSLVFKLQMVEGLYVRAAKSEAYGIAELQRDLRAWSSCQESLESLIRAKRLYGDKELPFHVFWHEWKELIHQGKVQVDSGAGAGINVFRPAEIRGLQFPVVFVLGLNEGTYPKKTGEHWLIERIGAVAGKYGRTLQRQEQSELQSLLFRYSIMAAGERLYFSYLSPEADERNLPSPYLEAVIRSLRSPEQQAAGTEANNWKKPARFRGAMSLLPIADRWDEISSMKEWRERLAVWLGGETSLHLAESPDQQTIEQLRAETAAWQELLERLEIEEERASGQPSRFAGRMLDPAIKAVLRQKFGEGFGWSVSLLNDYAVCPYKFFAARVLRIQTSDEVEDGIAANERGIFLHDLVQRLLLPLTRELKVGPVQAEQVLASYEPIFAETVTDWESAASSPMVKSPFWPAERERLRKEVRLWLEREVNRLLQSRMRPAFLEWSFGNRLRQDDPQLPDPTSTEELISLNVGDEPMRFRGRIDRIDLTEDRSRFAIFDYKTSLTNYKGMQNLDEGTNWQLPVYLAAFQAWSLQNGHEVSPLGGGFYKIGPYAEAMHGIWSAEAGNWGISDTKKNDIADDLAAVLDSSLEQIAVQREALRDGIFDVQPRMECDPYCKYAAVCRFDPTRKEQNS